MLAFDRLEKDTNFYLAHYDAKKQQTNVSWDATKVTNGCWFMGKTTGCKKTEKKPENNDENQVVDIFSSDEE